MTIKKYFYKVRMILKARKRKGVITMNGSDGGHISHEMTQKTAQKDLDDPGPRRFFPAALEVIGRLAN